MVNFYEFVLIAIPNSPVWGSAARPELPNGVRERCQLPVRLSNSEIDGSGVEGNRARFPIAQRALFAGSAPRDDPALAAKVNIFR